MSEKKVAFYRWPLDTKEGPDFLWSLHIDELVRLPTAGEAVHRDGHEWTVQHVTHNVGGKGHRAHVFMIGLPLELQDLHAESPVQDR